MATEKCNECLRTIVLANTICLIITICTGLFLFFVTKSEKLDISDSLKIITSIATVFIAFLAYLIHKNQAKIQEGQAITQMNQAFNQINQLLIQDQGLAKTAVNLCIESSGEKSEGGDKCKETLLKLMILNTYEAYFVNNPRIFDEKFPLILKNLLINDQKARDILCEHSFYKNFVNKCKEECKKQVDFDCSAEESSTLNGDQSGLVG